MADDASTSNESAAAKVFDIPELLEHILLELAEISEIESWENMIESDADMRAIEPLSCISAVRRVSRMFDGVIAGSQKIQRLIKQPLVRLGEEVGGEYSSSHCFKLPGGGGCFINIYAHEYDWETGSSKYPYQILVSGDFAGMKSHSSLRRVKINEDGRKLDIGFYPELDEEELKEFYLVIKGGATLGEIFDMGYNGTPEYNMPKAQFQEMFNEKSVEPALEIPSIDIKNKNPEVEDIEEAAQESRTATEDPQSFSRWLFGQVKRIFS